MNEKTEPAMPKGLEEAPTDFRAPVPVERPSVPAKSARSSRRPALRLEDLRDADLKGRDLTRRKGLLPQHLAGADLTGAKLPDEIARFPGLAQVAAISSEARKIFIGLLAACVYSWLVIGTTKDVQLIVNTATSPLPIINTPIPIAGFYVVGAGLLAAVYCYLHFYLHYLWRVLATLPAVFPDGVALDDKSDPWLLSNFVRVYFERLKPDRHPLKRLETSLSIALAWVLVPFTLFALWVRYLPSHGWLGTYWLVILTGFTTIIGWHFFRFARAALSGEAPPSNGPGLRGTWRELHALSWKGRIFWSLAVVAPLILVACSEAAFHINPRDDRSWAARGLIALRLLGIRTYADLREVNVAEPPDGWDGEDWSKVKRIDLRGSNLAFADLTRAFLVNADLRGADLTGANLRGTQLRGADLEGAQLRGADLGDAQLQNTNLRSAKLQGANLAGALLRDAAISMWLDRRSGYWMWPELLAGARRTAAVSSSNTQLQGAYLEGAQLQGADLRGAELQGVNLIGAQLQGADLRGAQLGGADLRYAQLQGANLESASLQGAMLEQSELQGANLTSASLKGADLVGAGLWRATIDPYDFQAWELVDLRYSNADPMTDVEIEDLIATAVNSIPDDKRREVVTKELTAALRTDNRPARPRFPEKWGSEPNVMFRCDGAPMGCDLRPEPLDWGPPRWDTEEAYHNDLAEFLGDLACGPEAPEAQTQALAQRALERYRELTVIRGGPRTHGRAALITREHPFAPRLAARLIAANCPPGQEIPDEMRRQLEQLAPRGQSAANPPSKATPIE